MKRIGTPSICNICKENCGIQVQNTGHGLRITGNPDHPVSKGFLCIRGKNFGEIHASPHRLQEPLLKNGSGWQPISYDKALRLLADRFDGIRQKYGAESVVFYKGESLKHQEISQYFSHLARGFGTPNYISVGSLCHFAMTLGFTLTCGGIPAPDYSRIKSAIIWGANPAVSLARSSLELKQALKEGLKLVVVDPSVTRTAELADCHLAITPGTDGYLALAFIKYAVLNQHIHPSLKLGNGWDDLCNMISDISIQDLLKPARISEEGFLYAASLIFGHLPGWIQTGSGLELQPVGVQTVRAISSLLTILDPYAVTTPMSSRLSTLPGEDGYPAIQAEPIGKTELPLFEASLGQGQGMLLPKAILQDDPYPVRAMMVIGGNPLMTFPGTPIYRQAFKKLDFLAVFDLFMTPTAQIADLVLPAATFLENLELIDYGRGGKPYLGLIRPVADTGFGWPAWKLIFRLADAFGLKNLFPWRDNKEAIKHRLSPGTITFDNLMESPSSTVVYTPEPRMPGQWNTPDKKVNYFSSLVEKTGNFPLPVMESFRLPHSPDDMFPFWLSTGDRVPSYQHSQFRESLTCKADFPKPVLDMHPEAASRLGIVHDEKVRLSTRDGRIDLPVRLTQEVRHDCLRLAHGWVEANANELTCPEYLDPLSGFPWMRALPARVERVAGQ
ncbi:molybdopterin-containing oxidoreductase family protein [Desulfotignum phosphitoxidans]|uniref:molybdopterin-containing oxidoreductase family protein n=1 Tax=Desulfotignum phosphitoxidans TaxID=190898 RepID=UPI001360B091|nr:molybdopterin-dependent oxidoreductase [Desulfotignum phosphitoxidans]